MEIPYLSKDLIAQLRSDFPLHLPKLDVSERELWADVGRQKLIAVLEHSLENQMEENSDVHIE